MSILIWFKPTYVQAAVFIAVLYIGFCVLQKDKGGKQNE